MLDGWKTLEPSARDLMDTRSGMLWQRIKKQAKKKIPITNAVRQSLFSPHAPPSSTGPSPACHDVRTTSTHNVAKS